MNMIKHWTAVLMCVVFLACAVPCYAYAEEQFPFDVDALSAVLMDAESGKILYSKNGQEPLPPASVTKVMTLLLLMEAIDEGRLALTDTVRVSEYAASMGGSQVYLEPNEEMSVEDLLKSVVVSSANDAAVALAEKIAGSEEAFVALMNNRAAELGMKNSYFENVTGLDDDTKRHLLSAEDIAIMSRELLRHEKILNYTTIWMDTIRNGAFGLSNTNRLIRYYSGATGLKTGSTSKAKFCISATAKREGMHLIAVIMGAPGRDARNEAAKKLLDWGFANYAVYKNPAGTVGDVPVVGGADTDCTAKYGGFSALLKKGEERNVVYEVVLPEILHAPIHEGDSVGQIIYRLGDTVIGSADITAMETIEKMRFTDVLAEMLKMFLMYK